MPMDVNTLSEKLGKEKTTIYKMLRRHNIKTTKHRYPSGAMVGVISDEEADLLIAEYAINASFDKETSNGNKQYDTGYFYIIAVTPDLKPERIKFGYAVDVGRRLQDHRCSAPTAEVLCSFPSERIWEPVAIAAITAGIKCERIGCEVYDVADVEQTIERARTFFLMMHGNEIKCINDEDDNVADEELTA